MDEPGIADVGDVGWIVANLFELASLTLSELLTREGAGTETGAETSAETSAVAIAETPKRRPKCPKMISPAARLQGLLTR